jgi:succinate dehydrogenase/fumarate reductase cytochrome b subunit
LVRRRSGSVALLTVASVCFVVVALFHLFEGLRLFPSVGWGQPRSIGHYLDLVSALLGLAFLVAALVTETAARLLANGVVESGDGARR